MWVWVGTLRNQGTDPWQPLLISLLKVGRKDVRVDQVFHHGELEHGRPVGRGSNTALHIWIVSELYQQKLLQNLHHSARNSHNSNHMQQETHMKKASAQKAGKELAQGVETFDIFSMINQDYPLTWPCFQPHHPQVSTGTLV